MSFKDLIKLVALVTILFSFSPKNYYGAHGAKNRPSKEEDMELDKQLKILNKPPVKTIRTKFGDTYDCIDLYKQPAFDHPLLKNHNIQMKPNLVLQEEKINKSAFGRFSSANFEISDNERCPMGTVPIRRTKKEELVNAKYFSKWVQTYSKKSNKFRECINIKSFQEPLVDNDYSPVGYWPKEIFTHLADNASEIKYGGVAGRIVPTELTPPVGNGNLQTLEFGTSCIISMMKMVNHNGKIEEVKSSKLELKGSTTLDCYDTMLPRYINSSYGTIMFFGGPGGICP